MSTAGKILVVLVLLLAPVWLVLVSGVAELNRSGGEQVAKLKAQVAKLEQEIAATQRGIAEVKGQIALEQAAMAEGLVRIRAQEADLRRARSETLEIASRVKYQLESMQEAARRAEATRDLRTVEKKQETDLKARAEAEVERLKQEHASLVDQLEKLRNQFKSTVDENRKLVDRLKTARSS
jgi:chromosome segregation ATPase